ncbi:MAG: hypothetical protein HQL86_07155 [Magnetococcales bacterium]|nr:hypothetical protein [Magnetococcales bacterium]
MGEAVKIHQLQAAYAPAEDRLLLRLSTTDCREFRFWLTRRFVQRLWPALRQSLESQREVAHHPDQAIRAAMLGFMHENATSQADFQAPFSEPPGGALLPLGETPILAVHARITPIPGHESLRQIQLHPERGHGIEVTMDMTLLHAFCKLLSDAVSAADWQMSLNLTAGLPPTVNTMEQGRVLH